MSKFNIKATDLIWICDNPDDPEDLCLHGHVKAEIGGNVLEDDGTVSATALYLLKTLTEDKLMAPHDIQMIPCCGHFMIANDDLTNVTILGCDYGTDWSTIHTARGVKIILPTGDETEIPLEEYKEAVFAFADSIEAFYQSCTPKKIPSDEFAKSGYIAFWNEWHRRRNASAENGQGMESEIVARVRQMEQYLDEILSVIDCCPDTLKNDVRLQELICTLREYYENGQWLRDYQSDERGELPAEIKRGVLAQDTLYNLFCDLDQIL